MLRLIDQLTSAVFGSRVGRVASLLRRGAPVNGTDKNGTTPLYKAAVQGEAEIVRVLLEAGADPNLESGGESEGTPLCAAAAWGRAEIVRLLIQHGADPNAVESENGGPMTALAWAERAGHAEVVKLLVEAGAHPTNFVKSSGRAGTYWDLRVACALISLDIVEPFLDELGFRGDNGTAARQAARTYIDEWRSREQGGSDLSRAALNDAAEAWLASVAEVQGAYVAIRIAELSDELATRKPHHLPWTGLMVALEGRSTKHSKPRLNAAKLAWLKKSARAYLAESDRLHTRIDALHSAKLGAWDGQLLAEPFYPPGNDEDTHGVHFDPGSWLWAWFDQVHWERFRYVLRDRLSAHELDELVSWGNGVIDPRWSLSEALILTV